LINKLNSDKHDFFFFINQLLTENNKYQNEKDPELSNIRFLFDKNFILFFKFNLTIISSIFNINITM